MSYPESLVKAERSLQAAFGVWVDFLAADGTSARFRVLPSTENPEQTIGSFSSTGIARKLNAVAEDLPADWREARLEMGGDVFNVVDVLPKTYPQLVEIEIE